MPSTRRLKALPSSSKALKRIQLGRGTSQVKMSGDAEAAVKSGFVRARRDDFGIDQHDRFQLFVLVVFILPKLDDRHAFEHANLASGDGCARLRFQGVLEVLDEAAQALGAQVGYGLADAPQTRFVPGIVDQSFDCHAPSVCLDSRRAS